MKTNYELRYASNPVDAKTYDTARLRHDFLIETLFVGDEVNMVYSMYDRMIVGGAMPVGEDASLGGHCARFAPRISPPAARSEYSM